MLKTVAAAPTVGNGPFTFTVPGHETWTVLSVVATCARAVGGAPNRSYLLTVANGAQDVALAPARDAGTEPGAATMTWAGTSAALVTAGGITTVLATLPTLTIPAGYTIVGTIDHPAGGDAWTGALAWVDFRYN